MKKSKGTERRTFSDEVLHEEVASATARVLHDTAQPLSVAIGTLELALQKRGLPEVCVISMTSVLEMLTQAVAGMNLARELVHFHDPVQDPTALSLTEILNSLITASENSFLSAGITVTLHSPADIDDQVMGCRSRVFHAVELVFSRLLSTLMRGERLDVAVEGSSRAVGIRLTVHRSNTTGEEETGARPKTESSRGHWDLIEVLVGSLGGRVSLEHVPTRVLLELPRAQYRLGGEENLFVATHAS